MRSTPLPVGPSAASMSSSSPPVALFVGAVYGSSHSGSCVLSCVGWSDHSTARGEESSAGMGYSDIVRVASKASSTDSPVAGSVSLGRGRLSANASPGIVSRSKVSSMPHILSLKWPPPEPAGAWLRRTVPGAALLHVALLSGAEMPLAGVLGEFMGEEVRELPLQLHGVLPEL